MNDSKLFQPFRINSSLTVKNRIVMVPIYTAWEYESLEFLGHHVRRAEGGTGLSIIPVPTWKGIETLQSPSFLDHSKSIIDLHHKAGCKIVAQVFPGEGHDVNTRDIGGIEWIADYFAQSALCIKEAGYDGFEIHSAHHSLFMHLLSPHLNKRTDCYGGSLENRMRIQTVTTEAIRKAVGPDFPLFVRFSASDLIENGADLDTTIPYAQRMESCGIDVVDVSCGGTTESPPYSMSPHATQEPGLFTKYSTEIKSSVSVPVIVAGRINTKNLAESILTEEKADLIGLGRSLIADPDLPNKWAGISQEPLVNCCYTNRGCEELSIAKGLTIQCVKNKNLGFEYSPCDI